MVREVLKATWVAPQRVGFDNGKSNFTKIRRSSRDYYRSTIGMPAKTFSIHHRCVALLGSGRCAAFTVIPKTIAFLILFSAVGSTLILAQTGSPSTFQPRLVSKPELQFPNEAYMGRVVGKVWLRVLVGTDGIPNKTDILRREPEMAYLFDNAARQWGLGCRFTQVSDSNEIPAPVWVAIPLSFALDHAQEGQSHVCSH